MRVVREERWLLEPAKPVSVQLAWLGMRSIIWREEPRALHFYACDSVDLDYVFFPPDKDHLWINGRGHVLESSEEEVEPTNSLE